MTDMTGLQLKPGTSWWKAYARCVATAPEAFESDRLLNLFDGRWQRVGRPGFHVNPVDGTSIQGPPPVDRDTAAAAVDAAVRQHVWEIGKPWRLACADVDRGLDGVRWYVEEIDRQLGVEQKGGRGPLPGPVSNIASWNYPMSVQVHAELVQALAGNAVVAKPPSQGGFHCLTLAHAFMARAGLPVTLLSGAARAGSSPARTRRPTSPRPACWNRPPSGRCTTPSRSARSTRWCASTPRPSS